MLQGKGAEMFRQTVEKKEGDDGYNYERWEAVVSGLFTAMGIIRAVTEGSFSPEERVRAVDATEVELRSMSDLFPEEDRKALSEAIALLRTPNKTSENFLRDTIGDRIRFGAQMIVQTAPTEDIRNARDEVRKEYGSLPNPVHLWLKNLEVREISDRLSAALNTGDHDPSTISLDLLDGIGALQRLLTIIEKLRTPIDNEKIQIDGRTTNECIAIITAARDSILRSFIPYDQETATSGVPDFDPALLNTDVLEDAADICSWLYDVKMRSV